MLWKFISLDMSEIKNKIKAKDSLCILVFCSVLQKELHGTTFSSAHIL